MNKLCVKKVGVISIDMTIIEQLNYLKEYATISKERKNLNDEIERLRSDIKVYEKYQVKVPIELTNEIKQLRVYEAVNIMPKLHNLQKKRDLFDSTMNIRYVLKELMKYNNYNYKSLSKLINISEKELEELAEGYCYRKSVIQKVCSFFELDIEVYKRYLRYAI